MIKENSAFAGVLKSFKTKAKEEETFQQLTITHTEEGENQSFLNSYADRCKENIKPLFSLPVAWKSISIEAAFRFKVIFDEIEFLADIREIKIRKKYVRGTELFTYDLIFEKELSSDQIDLILPTYVNQKEVDETTGKKSLIHYNVFLEPLEALFKD